MDVKNRKISGWQHQSPFYKVDIPGATVYVDTDSYAKAGEVALSVVQAKMLNSGATWNGPDPIRIKLDRNREKFRSLLDQIRKGSAQ